MFFVKLENDGHDEMFCSPPEIREAASTATLNLLPEKSYKTYETAYELENSKKHQFLFGK